MRIIKVRRGYTTNSSAASEFVPPESWSQGSAPVPPVPGGAPPGGPQAPAPGSTAKPFPIPVRPGEFTARATPGADAAAGVAPPGQTIQQPQAPASPPAPGLTGTGVLGGLAALVGIAFVAERGIRAALKRWRRHDDNIE